MTLSRYAFERFNLPSDDVAATALTVTASLEDPEYPAENLIAPTTTAHLNLPSRPAKLGALTGSWTLTFAAPVTLQAAILVYTNFDADLDVSLDPAAGTPVPFDIPSRWENGWWPNPSIEFDPQTASSWTLSINGTNSVAPQVGRLLLYGSGGFRDLTNDLRWGVVEDEIQGQIEQPTEADVETLFELFGPRRSFTGEMYLKDDTAEALQTLFRDARNRILPWPLIPDQTRNPNDVWFVRFSTPTMSRTRDMIENNIYPFRVTELSRGLPWP